MQKNYFHNSKINIDFLETKTPIKKQYIRKKEKVDINTLLNKVKLEEKKEKKKIFILCLGVSLLMACVTFASII